MRSREGCRKQAGPGALAILRGPKDPLFYPSAKLGQSDTGYDWSTFRHSGYSCVINKIIFRALVLLYNRQLVTPMYGAILESFPSYRHCVVRNGSTLMIAEGLNLLYFSTIALIVAFLTARIASKKDRAIFKRQHFPTLKSVRTAPSNCRSRHLFAMHATTIFFLGSWGADTNCCHHPANLWLSRESRRVGCCHRTSVSNRGLPAAH